jgi:hypothetical protein
MSRPQADITWAIDGTRLRAYCGASPSEDWLLQQWLAMAVDAADKYLDRDFTVTVTPETPEYLPGYGYVDDWLPGVGPTATPVTGVSATVPAAIRIGCYCYVKTMRLVSQRESGVTSRGTGPFSESLTTEAANMASTLAFRSAVGYWRPYKRAVWRCGIDS